MMDIFSENEEKDQFFDALDEFVPEPHLICSSPYESYGYDVWIGTPQSVGERRRNFVASMGLDVHELRGELAVDSDNVLTGDIDRIMDNFGAVLRTSSIDDELLSSRLPVSSDNDCRRLPALSRCINVNVNFNFGSDCVMDENQRLDKTRLSDHFVASGRIGNGFQRSASVPLEHLVQRGNEVEMSTPRAADKEKHKWLGRWHSMNCVGGKNAGVSDSLKQAKSPRIRRVKVRHGQRKLKELSALFTEQDIQAHKGSILTMKFSPGGQYLASAGEDKVVRVWKVVEHVQSNSAIQDADPSCVYFSVNHLHELEPLRVEKDKDNKSRSRNKTQDPACIIIPPKVFRILEKPLHVFSGHTAEILDLSWSRDNCLLSSSADKTVRLWSVGVDHCLKVFHHTDYVTCIQFNPVNDDHFISGSIDGKVRIWTISDCQVVQWTETKNIITAVSYHPNAEGGIIGFITGTCRFFNLSGNHLQLETETCLTNKKKPHKRITGFQFFPQDPRKVLVTCSDSQLKIIDGSNVIAKCKGPRKGANYTSATFTSNGKHIVSASDDAKTYLWNFTDVQEPSLPLSSTKVDRSFECFYSNSLVAIPWPGSKSCTLDQSLINSLSFSSSTRVLPSQEFNTDSSKVSATWPEESLLPSSIPQSKTPPLTRSQYKLLKTCQGSTNTHAWGLVVVTGGWDGRIRSFQNYGLPIPI